MVLVTSTAMAANMWTIPLLGTADTTTQGRTVIMGKGALIGSPIVVGQSSSNGIIWDPTNGTRLVNSSDGAGATVVTGLGYRTVPGGRQLVAHGMTSSGHNLYASPDNGVTWGVKNRLTNTYDNPYQMGSSNSLAVSPTLDGDGTQKVYFGFAWNQANATSKMGAMVTASDGAATLAYKATLSVASASMTSNSSTVMGVSYTSSLTSAGGNLAIGVGKRSPNAYYFTSAGGKVALTTMSGTLGEAWAVSKDGMVVGGWGPMSGRTGNWPFILQDPFGVKTVTALPLLLAYGSGGVQSTIVYGLSEDGKWAVGRDYSQGADYAVLWDLHDANPANWREIDLTAWATAQGALGDFATGNGLSKGYSVTTDYYGHPVITGEGWTTAGTSRGFVIDMVPEPATVGFLALGGLFLLRRRR